ncbi:hypothetical protein BGX26_012797 [Mortierella sp. AD094]|nr:hypothetical protein BGX26_012797 [Mortierella sp. AD094]
MDHKDLRELSNPLPATSSEKDTLPSADVLFGGSSPFDLFSPGPVMPRKPPVQQPQNLQPIQPTEQPKTPLHSFKQHQVGHKEGCTTSDTESLFSSPQIPTTKLTAPREQDEEDRTHRGPVASVSQRPDNSHETTKGVVSQTSASHHETLQKERDHSSHSEEIPSSKMAENSTLFRSDGSDRKTTLLDSLERNSKPDEPDSSSLFTGTKDMDASQLFLGTSPMDPNSFFTGLSRAVTTKEHYIRTSDAGTLLTATYPNHHFSKVTAQPLSSSEIISNTDQIGSQEGSEDVKATKASASASRPAKMDPTFDAPFQDSVVASTESEHELSLSCELIQPHELFISPIDRQLGDTLSPEPAQETTGQIPGLVCSKSLLF